MVVTSLGGVVVPLDYTTRDYEGFRADALTLAGTLTPEWTDFYPTDPGVVLIEAMSYMADILSYYIDRAANECFLSTMTQRRSAINLGRLVGYELSPATSAVVMMTFVCNAGGNIPAGQQVSTDPAITGESAVVYEVRTTTIAGAAGALSVECIEGTSTSQTLGSGTALPSQSFTLTSSPLSYDPAGDSSLRVYVDEGAGLVLYTEVTNFLDSESSDRHYTVRIDESDVATITFGDGVNGRVVVAGVDNVSATYRVGGGAAGNSVGIGQITKLVTTLPFVDSVTNPAAPQGGADKESVEDARTSIPASVRSLDRCITHQDYEDLAVVGVAGVAQAKAVWGRGPYEEVVYVAAAGSNPIANGTWDPDTETGTGLLGEVGDYLVARKASPVRLVVKPPSAAELEFALSLKVNAGFFQDDCRVEVIDTLLETVEAYRMGEEVVLSDVLGALEALPSVNKVRVSLFRRKPAAVLVVPDPLYVAGTPDATWAVGTTDDTDHDSFVLSSTLQPTLQEVLTVVFISANTFRVRGSKTGRQGTVGTVGALWTNDLGNLTLTCTAGAIPTYAGNQFRITVGSGAVTTSIELNSYDIATLAEADIDITSVTGGIV